MINTQMVAASEPLPLKMYNLDTKQLVNRFHDQMVDYLENNNTMSGGAFKETLSISRDLQDLNIGGWDINTIGIKQAKLIKQGDRTISEFADYILTSYIRYLHSQENKQSKMDHKQICELLAHDDGRKALFSSRAYIDWTVDNLENLDVDSIEMNYIFDTNQHINDYDYFIQKLVVKLPQCNTIDGSVLSLITATIAFQYKVRIQYGATIPAELFIFSNQIQSLVKNATNLSKITHLNSLNYNSICKLFTLTNLHEITLPLLATLNISSTDFNKDVNFQFYVTTKEDLQTFINNLCEKRSPMPTYADKLSSLLNNHNIVFYFNDYKSILNSQIKALHDNFYHVERMTTLSNILTLILNHA